MSRSPKRLVALSSAAVAFAGMAVLAPPAHAVSPNVVISEVYGGGGNSGAPYQNDFIELFNRGAAPVDLTGWAVQYRSATGTTAQVTNLTGSLAPGAYYLVQEAAGAANPPAPSLPTPDATGSISMSGTNGVVVLTSDQTPYTAPAADLAGAASPIVDAVGYGTTPTTFETSNTGVALTNSTAAHRDAAGADTDDNADDFDEASPTPKAAPGSGPAPFTGTIAEIQGNTAISPKDGVMATTSGVVTAAYLEGGLNGFYMQTAGSGGVTDPTPDASDAIFVFVGSDDLASIPAVGNTADVVGLVKEFNGLTEIDATVDGASVADGGAATPIVPRTGPLPGTGCALPGTACLTGTALAAAQEAHEGELWDLSGDFTVTDAFDGSAFGGEAWGTSSSSSMFGEVGLAASSTEPLVSPTEVVDAQDDAGIDARTAYNKAHQLVLDDASSITYWNTSGTGRDDLPFPWYTPTNPVRVGASVTFAEPMIYSDGFGTRRLIPVEQVTDDGTSVGVDFTNTRPAGPSDVGGDVKLATFNVLNFFPVSAAEFVALNPATNTCSAFFDRDDNPIAVNSCNPNGPRGAWDDTNLRRQRSKIVKAINAVDADVVSLEEIENSVHFGRDRDDAVKKLVAALNSDAGSTRWAYVPSPAAADLPSLAEQDVIRNAFIYNPAKIKLVGASEVLVGNAAFNNAREPLAQAFKIRGTGKVDAFGVIVNHFKSKGSGTPDPDGQGNATVDRVAQANGLLDFAEQFEADRGIERMFLVGDFNAYSEEDPVQEIELGADSTDGTADDYTALEDTIDGTESYSFSGLSGSLDHIFANDAALAEVTDSDVVDINASEFVFNQYSRFNYNVAQLFDRNTIYASSDHNPEVVGINKPNNGVEIQILGTNDFHGRLTNDTGAPTAGAAVLAGAVKQLRNENPNTVFAAAGDLIGASTFDSFIDRDKPTIDALNEAGLDVSAVGNHEFDAGYDDLVNRVMAPFHATTNPQGGAAWEYIGANLEMKATGDPTDIAPSWIEERGGVTIGFVGAVTEELPSLVSPDGIAEIQVTDIVQAVNDAADDLKTDEGADIIVMLVHEGSGTTNCDTMDDDPTTPFGEIIHGVNDNIDAIVSGHTHLEYDCSFPVAGWAGRAVTDRPVVSAGQYGMALNQLVFDVDPATGEVLDKSQTVLRLKNGNAGSVFNYPADSATAAIVSAAVAKADVLGSVTLGEIAGPFSRARFSNGAENRGGESTLGNLVAEVQRWATQNPESGSAQIAFMNPGGLRQDLTGNAGAFPKPITYRQAANVQPFANTLVNMDLTGAQIKAALEQQWQPDSASRSFLRLGSSKGFEYTYDPATETVTGMWLNGTPIGLGTTYSVTVNSFLAAGGDNFGAFAGGTNKQDTGKADLQAMVDYMAEFANTGAGDPPLPISFAQQAVGVKFPADAPASYLPTGHVTFDLTSLSMTETGALRDTEVTVRLGGTTLGTFPVETVLTVPDGNATSKNTNDESGTASVDVVLPASTPAGTATLVVEGATTGTSFEVPVNVTTGTTEPPAPASTTVGGSAEPFRYGKEGLLEVVISRANATGQVEVLTDKGVKLGTVTITAGMGTLTLAPKSLKPGLHELTLKYLGTSEFAPSTGEATVRVLKGRPKVKVKVDKTIDKSEGGKVVVRVTAPDDIKVRGKVKLVVKGTGKSVTGKLVKGKIVFELPKLSSVGTYTLKAKYLGSKLLQRTSKSVKIELVK